MNRNSYGKTAVQFSSLHVLLVTDAGRSVLDEAEHTANTHAYTHTHADKNEYAFVLRYAPVLHARLDKLRTRGTSPCSTISRTARETAAPTHARQALVLTFRASFCADNVPRLYIILRLPSRTRPPLAISTQSQHSTSAATNAQTPSPDTPLLLLLR